MNPVLPVSRCSIPRSSFQTRGDKKTGRRHRAGGGEAGSNAISAPRLSGVFPPAVGGGRGRRESARTSLACGCHRSSRPANQAAAQLPNPGLRHGIITASPLPRGEPVAPATTTVLRARTSVPERRSSQRPNGARTEAATGMTCCGAADGATRTGAPPPSAATTTAGPSASVPAAARDAANAPAARTRRTWRVGIWRTSGRGSPRPGMGAIGGNRSFSACSPRGMASPRETRGGIAIIAPPGKKRYAPRGGIRAAVSADARSA